CQAFQTGQLANSSDEANTKSDQDAIKVTDKLLVLFTGCLVIVGIFQAFYLWSTFTSAERTTKTIETAYVFAGIGKMSSRTDENGKVIWVTFGPSPANYGKTPALISHIDWGICPESEIPPDPVPNYPNRLFVGWTLRPEGHREETLELLSLFNFA